MNNDNTSVKMEFEDIGTDSTKKILGFLKPDEVINLCGVGKTFNKNSLPIIEKNLKDYFWNSEDRITKNIEALMKCAIVGASLTPNQQLWMLEAILSKPIEQKKRAYSKGTKKH